MVVQHEVQISFKQFFFQIGDVPLTEFYIHTGIEAVKFTDNLRKNQSREGIVGADGEVSCL